MNRYLDKTLNSLLEKHISGEQMTDEETKELHEHAAATVNGIQYRYKNAYLLFETDAIICELAGNNTWAQMVRESPFYAALSA